MGLEGHEQPPLSMAWRETYPLDQAMPARWVIFDYRCSLGISTQVGDATHTHAPGMADGNVLQSPQPTQSTTRDVERGFSG